APIADNRWTPGGRCWRSATSLLASVLRFSPFATHGPVGYHSLTFSEPPASAFGKLVCPLWVESGRSSTFLYGSQQPRQLSQQRQRPARVGVAADPCSARQRPQSAKSGRSFADAAIHRAAASRISV